MMRRDLVAALMCVPSFFQTLGPAQASDIIDATPDAVVRALEAAMILSGQEGGDIRVAAWSGVFELGDEDAWIVLVVEIDGPAILENVVDGGLEVDVYLYALDEDHVVETALAQHVQVDLARYRALLQRSGLKIPFYLSLAPGEHLLRLLVRTGEHAFGIRSLPVSVIGETAADLGSRPPVFPDQSDGWLVVLPGARVSSRPPARLPFVTRDEEFLPTALPILQRGETLRGLLFVSPDTTIRDGLEAVLRPALEDTEVRWPVNIRNRSSSPALQLDILEFELPEVDLPSEVYTAVVELNSGGETQDQTPPFNLVVTSQKDATSWPQLDLDSAARSSPGAIAGPAAILQPEPSTSDNDLANEETIRQYRQVLGILAQHGFDLARPGLRALEEQSTHGSAGPETTRLGENQYRVALELSEQGADLLPIMVLHALAAQDYRARGQNLLTRHSIRLIQHLVEASSRQGQSPGTRSAVADLLAEVATGEAVFGNLAQAVLLFEEALDCDRQNPAALLGLALVYERQGRYANATGILERLLTERPDHAEATLRLGVNLARQSRPGRAQTLLSRITSTEVEPWIAQLAFQELARIVLEERGPQQAIEILREGLRNWPGDFDLSVQLAFCLESAGHPAAAHKILDALEPSPLGSWKPSARWLYHQPPSWSRSSRIEALSNRAQEWLPDLQKALMATDPVMAQG